MRVKPPKNTDRISWTKHSIEKMRYYQLSESRLKRVLNNPKRKELGIAPGTIALMQPANPKHSSEIWLMYQIIKSNSDGRIRIVPTSIEDPRFWIGTGAERRRRAIRMRIITAWRYPGKSPIRGPIPIPSEILEELGEFDKIIKL